MMIWDPPLGGDWVVVPEVVASEEKNTSLSLCSTGVSLEFVQHIPSGSSVEACSGGGEGGGQTAPLCGDDTACADGNNT